MSAAAAPASSSSSTTADGAREISAAKHRLATAKESAEFASQMAAPAAEKLAAARVHMESIQTQLRDAHAQLDAAQSRMELVNSQVTKCQKELKEAEDYLETVEKRYEVINLDDDRDRLSPAADEPDESEDEIRVEYNNEHATKEDFEKFRDFILGKVPKNVKSRFREGGFSKWGRDWLPVLEVGPFDVEPGPIRDMWIEMFNNTQPSGKDMTSLVYWYGIKFENRGQAFSFVPANKIVSYEEGESLGYMQMPKKIKKKLEAFSRLSKTEEQITLGLRAIRGDMTLEKSERMKWMMDFKEGYELTNEEAVEQPTRKRPRQR